MKNGLRLLVCLVLSLFLAACASSKHHAAKTDPGLSPEAKAVEIAKKEFIRTGRSLDKYRVTAQNDRSGNVWVVWFERKDDNPPPGTTFVINVDVASGRALLVR